MSVTLVVVSSVAVLGGAVLVWRWVRRSRSRSGALAEVVLDVVVDAEDIVDVVTDVAKLVE